MSDPETTASANGSHPDSHSAFALLHPGVQRQLYRMQWAYLRPLQVEAIHAILKDRCAHAVIAAATASGKTEAAFLPVLSRIADEPTGSVRAIYIGPLKALINDQFQRVEELCGYLDVPVFRWHGDVSGSHKEKLVKQPGGVLLITPESLESLFVNRSTYLRELLVGLRFVVIDELHSFLGNERGLHLRSLLARVRQLQAQFGNREFGSIGLSATIGDPTIAMRYLHAAGPEKVALIEDKSDTKELRLRVHGYRRDRLPDEESEDEDRADHIHRQMAGDIVRHCAGSSNLIFANAKGDVEEFADLCQQLAEEKRLDSDFRVHHGSLSAEIREDTEAVMKEGRRSATTICSSTLEMGIDIGSVRMVGQIGAPWAVSSLKQRLGRSGRREGEPRILRMYLECQEPSAEANIFDRVHLNLVQSVAVTSLLLEGWVEPDVAPKCDLSTLTQQIISVIAQHGGARADAVYKTLCGGPDRAFHDIESPLFASLLRSLAAGDIIEQMSSGDLILGMEGERLRRDRGFYAVFPTPIEYTLVHEATVLGTLELVPLKDDYLLFAGKRWQVEEIDYERRKVHLKRAKGWKRPRFLSAAGTVHKQIRRRMREILNSQEQFAFLDPSAQSLLAEAREAAADGELCDRSFLPLGPRRTAVMTWAGSRVQETLTAMFLMAGHTVADEEIALVLNLGETETIALVAEIAQRQFDPLDLARCIPDRLLRKYDQYLSDDLLNVSVMRGRLETAGALRTVTAVSNG